MKYIIRPAERQDLSAIYQFVKQLAIYEREPEAVTATFADYERDFDAGIFEALVAEADGEIVGMALYFMAYSTWKGRMIYLEDFIVKQEIRKEGIGQLLFEELKKVAKAKQAVLLKWQVLDWNEPALKFYEKNNAIIETEWLNGKLFL